MLYAVKSLPTYSNPINLQNILSLTALLRHYKKKLNSKIKKPSTEESKSIQSKTETVIKSGPTNTINIQALTYTIFNN